MTPEQRAKEVYREWSFSTLMDDKGDVKALADAIREAVAEEREACAALVERMGVNLATSAADYARAIRRGPK